MRKEKQNQKEAKKMEKREAKRIEQIGIGLATLSLSQQEEDMTQCPTRGLLYDDDDSGNLWVSCDKCLAWFDFKCTDIQNKRKIPKTYVCRDT